MLFILFIRLVKVDNKKRNSSRWFDERKEQKELVFKMYTSFRFDNDTVGYNNAKHFIITKH